MPSAAAFALQSPARRPPLSDGFRTRSPVTRSETAAEDWWNTQTHPEDTAVTNDIALRLRINAAKVFNTDTHRQFLQAQPAFSPRLSRRDSSRSEATLESPPNDSPAPPSCSPPELPSVMYEPQLHRKPPTMFEWFWRGLKRKPTNREKRTSSR